MEDHADRPPVDTELRRQAEAVVRERTPQSPAAPGTLAAETTQQMLHELQVHQIELELQNEELRRAQAQLDAARARYFDLYDLAPVSYLTVSGQGLILEANLTAAALLGADRNLLVQQRLSCFMLPEDQNLYYLHRQQLLATGTPQTWEMRLVRQNNAPFWAQLQATVAQDADGATVCRVVISEITERKQAERFRLVADFAYDWEYWLASDGSLPYVSPSCEHLTGYRAEEFQQDPGLLLRIVHPEDQDRVARHDGCVPAGECHAIEFRIFTRGGEERWIAHASRPVADVAGKYLGERVTNRDITEIKQAEKALSRVNCQLEASLIRARELTAQAQAADAAKSRFLAAMSHEIRTPLNAILGFSQLLQRDTRLALDQQQRVATINRSGEHLLALLTDILDFAKIEAGRQTLVAFDFDLPALLRDLETTFRLQAEAKQLTLCLEGLEAVPRYVVGDRVKLWQILTNLLDNAVKFTATGGVWVRASTEPQGTERIRLVVLVGDSGPGIGAKELGRLFTAFEQGDVGGNRASGTGLGLAISRQLARLMGGDLSVTSEFGHGSVFRLEILTQPAAQPMSAAEPADSPLPQLAGGQPGYRVLVVEDNDDNREIVVELLGTAGFEVCEAVSGLEAVQAFASWHPQLILMDHQLPGLSGDEAVRRIRQSPDGEQVQIIMVSAHAGEEFRDQARLSGADDFLSKPFRLAELCERIRLRSGLRYVAAQGAPADRASAAEAPTPRQEQLDHLPAAIQQQLREAARRGRQVQLCQTLQQVVDPELRRQLQDLAAKFDYQLFLQLLS